MFAGRSSAHAGMAAVGAVEEGVASTSQGAPKRVSAGRTSLVAGKPTFASFEFVRMGQGVGG